jgi:hypothetical protein
MGSLNELGKVLVVVGLAVVVLGALLWSGFGKGWIGQLPGDIRYSRGNVHFYFPLVSCVLLSIVLSLLLWLFRR